VNDLSEKEFLKKFLTNGDKGHKNAPKHINSAEQL
jgi:hypothetical protein